MINALGGSIHGLSAIILVVIIIIIIIITPTVKFDILLIISVRGKKYFFYNNSFYFYFTESREAVKPEFIAEPNDEYVQSNSSVSLYCEARFVLKLEINCSGGLVPETGLQNEDENNTTWLIVDVSHSTIKARNLARVSCVCYATGYKGSLVKSRPAVVALACKL